ncbi:beta-ketoacyl synthase N-terminal-like domain-containing protein [Pollutibacter soli]|uniref:beta-ketoacyl synthase N-terminal-like domain-containing protein n=1 Tax=Pollutibacter soli TaxID=3034157 RepID=UPI003014049B
MRKGAFIVADNIYSPAGSTTRENFETIIGGGSGVRTHEDISISKTPFVASLIGEGRNGKHFPDSVKGFSRFENLLTLSVQDALRSGNVDPKEEKTLLIISSTKGNISMLESGGDQIAKADAISLVASAKKIAAHFQFQHQPLVISNACISGLLAIITAKRLIESDSYETVVVAGADEITSFIFSGFQSFQALSDTVCRPFDAARKGINLGEGAATIILSGNDKYEGNIRISGGSVRNDANHISGPSRTGEELFLAINSALDEAGLKSSEIEFISAHGTATIYNDEMEAKAISLANLQDVPVNSLKGYFGHTLGAAGIIETIITKQSMLEGLIVPTPGFEESGVSMPLNISNKLRTASITHSLKTASGFGGCNAAITLSR